jgi:major membrane immunogen (membrane-anchored lipoprotein)
MKNFVLLVLLLLAGCSGKHTFVYRENVVVTDGFYKGQKGQVEGRGVGCYWVDFDWGGGAFIPPSHLERQD